MNNQKADIALLPTPMPIQYDPDESLNNPDESLNRTRGSGLARLKAIILMAWRLWKMWIPPIWLIISFIMPIGMFAVFGLNQEYSNMVFGQVTISALIMCNMAQYSVFTTSASIAARVGVEAANGWLHQLKSTSIKISIYHASRIVAIVVIAALQTAAVYIFGAIEGVRMGLVPLLLSALALILTVIFTALMGLTVGAIIKSDAASGVIGSASWLVAMFSGMYMPLESLGSFFVKLGYYMPLWGMNQLLRAGLAGDSGLLDYKVLVNISLWVIILLLGLYLGNKRAVKR